MIILAAAVGANNELGRESGVPLWDLPDEYRRFRESIVGHPIIIGRKSYDVIKEPLPNSLNIVVTRQKDYDGNGATVAHSLQGALDLVKSEPIIYIIGGGYIFEMAMDIADRIEISRIEGTFPDATAFFPKFSTDDWQLISTERHGTDERHKYAFNFEIWERKK
ncbi:MAG: dihydrofolate reductase [Chitinophagaceae bacterium]|nr:dihydrofolate reductase [Chitinophagaceae bacterium]